MSVFKSVREYRIDLDKEGATYYPGEEVTGKLVLETSDAIKCRGIRVRLEGFGACHWHHGSGDKRKDFSGSKKYVSKRVTVFGNFYRTQLLDEAGENAYFDAATGGGDMPFEARGDETLAVRVMDYDWGKRDDMLGECTVRLADLLARGGEAVSFPLFRKGGGGRGEVTLSAAPSAAGITVLRCHQATGLKQGDWFGKNDVYVQCYEVGATSNASEAALPEPDKHVELPADRHEYAFSFSIPDVDLPSSADGPMPHVNADAAHVRYSLYSNVDIKMRMDPSTRLPITVVAKPRLPPPAAYAPVQRADRPPQEMYACDCCVACGLGCPQGTAQFQAAISHTAPCVGDVVHVSAVATNNTQGNAKFHVDLVTLVTLRTRGSQRATYERKPVSLGSVDVPAGSTAAFGTPEVPRALEIPSLPPPFAGDAYEPVTWTYAFRLYLKVEGCDNDLVWQVPASLTTVPQPVVFAQDNGYATLAVVVADAGVGTTPPPPQGALFAGNLPVAPVVSVLGSTPIADAQEDEHNFRAGGERGAPPPFAPVYYATVVDRPTPCGVVFPSTVATVVTATPATAPAAVEMAGRDDETAALNTGV